MATSTEAEGFDEFDDALKLDPDERQRAVDIHNQMADILIAEEYVDGHFLQGSLARKTMTKPLRDIDMVVTLSRSFARRYAGALTEKGIRASASADAGPTAAMLALRDALEPHLPGVTFEIGKHALTIDFGSDSFKFDVVPALDEGDDVFIANTETGLWERSNTRQLIRTVSERNRQCNGRFVHQARMAKHVVKEDSELGGKFFGLLSESVAFHAITHSMPHAEACTEIFRVGAELLAGSEIVDPTGEDNLLRKLDPVVKANAQRIFAAWYDRAVEARQLADAGDHLGSIAMWHSIFGEAFPEAPRQSVGEAARAWLGGGVASSGRVTPRTTRQTARPARAWRST